MTRPPQDVAAPSLWVRVTALLCMLLTAGLVVPQACHTHLKLDLSSWHTVLHAAEAGDDAIPEDGCSICVALQAGAPSAPVSFAHVLLHATGTAEAREDHRAGRPLAFSLKSRPPPAVSPA